MSFIVKIALTTTTLDGVFTPNHYVINISDANNTVVSTQNIGLDTAGAGEVQSTPIDLPDGAYIVTAQLIDTDQTARGDVISQPITMPLPATTTSAQIPSAISIVAA